MQPPVSVEAPRDPVAEGLFDLQVNGFAGVDFQAEPSLEEVRFACERLRACGVTRILATFITNSAEALLRKFKTFAEYRAQERLIADTLAGFHLEGPYISGVDGYRGAHPALWVRDPDWSEFERWQEAAAGEIRLVTLAPERPKAVAFIGAAVATGVRISLGHTNASDSQIAASIDAGATLCTHVGNGCPLEMHRHDNVIQRLLARDELTACFIPDGIHLPPRVLRNFVRAKPEGRVVLVSDAMAAAAAGPGRYSLGSLEVEVGDDQVVRAPGSSLFAGSALRLDEGVQRASRWLGIPQEIARAMASSTPALALGFPVPPASLHLYA
jgi:N-acetylglucosamine-6-phosphate deacetylase